MFSLLWKQKLITLYWGTVFGQGITGLTPNSPECDVHPRSIYEGVTLGLIKETDS